METSPSSSHSAVAPEEFISSSTSDFDFEDNEPVVGDSETMLRAAELSNATERDALLPPTCTGTDADNAADSGMFLELEQLLGDAVNVGGSLGTLGDYARSHVSPIWHNTHALAGREGSHAAAPGPKGRKQSIMDYTLKQDVEDPPLYESRLFYFWPSEVCAAFVKPAGAGRDSVMEAIAMHGKKADGSSAVNENDTTAIHSVFRGHLANHLASYTVPLKKQHVFEAYELSGALARLVSIQMRRCLSWLVLWSLSAIVVYFEFPKLGKVPTCWEKPEFGCQGGALAPLAFAAWGISSVVLTFMV